MKARLSFIAAIIILIILFTISFFLYPFLLHHFHLHCPLTKFAAKDSNQSADYYFIQYHGYAKYSSIIIIIIELLHINHFLLHYLHHLVFKAILKIINEFKIFLKINLAINLYFILNLKLFILHLFYFIQIAKKYQVIFLNYFIILSHHHLHLQEHLNLNPSYAIFHYQLVDFLLNSY